MVAVRATLTLRNEKMLRARERMGISQRSLAEAAGVGIEVVGEFERFRWTGSCWDALTQKAARIAGILDIDVDDVLPPELRGKSVVHRHVRQVEMQPGLLVSGASESSISAALPDGGRGDTWDMRPLGDALDEAMRDLPARMRFVLRARFGLNGLAPLTIQETADALRLSRDRVRQIEAKAVLMLGHPSRALEQYIEG